MGKSILIIRPEAFSKKAEVISELKKRGYNILLEKEYDNWEYYSRKIYSEFSDEEFKFYMKAFSENGFGENFILLILECDGDCVSRLRSELGNFLKFQEGGNSLRSLFGRSKEYNFDFGRFTFTFPGLHCCDSLEEYQKHLELFELEN